MLSDIRLTALRWNRAMTSKTHDGEPRNTASIVHVAATLSIVAALCLPSEGRAQSSRAACDKTDTQFAVTAAMPDNADALRKYERNVSSLSGDVSTVLLGDSLVEAWPRELSASLGAGPVANLGVGRDRIQNTLWFIEHERERLRKIRPKSIIVLVGTNNIYLDKPCGLMESYQKLFEEIRSLWPNGRIFSIQILPRGEQMKGATENIASVNAELSRRSRELGIRTIDASDIACGRTTPCANYKSDLLHLTPSGYEALTRIAKQGIGSS
ncbi:GDSL-type esterase/lipase family protein [Bradyrhizobium sp. 41S5]|uniref:SGNH/GDSL hydrolase family protein n=1 Tax=Bradyrhizobium sp. 41S5 TaxID=1404443 RepID=UPI00156B7C92|nr:GDSL-type esterase/lipase family protein [Bradyrhizobium sp. 41S5]UFX42811.1 GDSL-type esterase/lipase family protein [Bradyrhizobium sp. 41S5]